MAEAVVSITLETIRNLLAEEFRFYCGVRSEVEAIQQELNRMRAFLKDADSKQDGDDRVRNWVSEVREASYDVEDNVLLFFSAKAASRNSSNLLSRLGHFFQGVITTYRIGSRISGIRRQITGLTTSLQTYGIRSDAELGTTSRAIDLRRQYSHVVEEDFVGLQEAITMLVEHLMDEQRERVVSIIGMGGLGKTTIARKLYSHIDLRRHFDALAWACVSQQRDKRDLMQGILIKLVPERREEIIAMRNEELVRQLHDVQLKKKCFVVLDDIWTNEDWQSLAPAFPNTRNVDGSKMLLTTRNKQIAVSVNPTPFFYEPRFLSSEESWELLRKKVFPVVKEDAAADEVEIDADMEKLGKEMVIRCCGLPLAILVLGGVLIEKRTPRDWSKVNDSIKWHLAQGGGHGQLYAVNKVLAFSYHDLPYQFKQCFLYLANFPEDFEIEAEKLYQYWLAEGIISQDEKAEGQTMMDVAERYLAVLAQRSMVQVDVKETAGGFKSCRLHDLMREFCISKAKDENFSKVIDLRHGKTPAELSPPAKTTRRVSFYLDPHGSNSAFTCDTSHIRSAFFYGDDCRSDILQRSESHLRSLKLLRVLYLQGFDNAVELPNVFGDMIHLRHLSLSDSQFKKLPSSLGRLIYLETLNLEMDESPVIPNVIWKMKRLKHLYLPKNFSTGDGKKLRLDGLSDLETLVNFDTRLCDVKDLDPLTNLRKLRASIMENLDDMPSIIKYISFTQNRLKRSSLFISCPEFCSDEELSQLRTLLSCHRLYKLSIRGRIAKLPEHYHFSESIAKITFKASSLMEDPMGVLEKLPKLSSLTLLDSAYIGESMSCLTKGFPQLLYLKLWGLSGLKVWRIDEGAMPKLTRLVVAYCNKLEMLPDRLKCMTTIQKLNVRWMSEDFKNRLRPVDGHKGVDWYKVRHIVDIKVD